MDGPDDDVAPDDTPDGSAEGASERRAPAQGRHAAPATGHPAVDAVLASLEGLEDKPVHEHVAVFESAHDSLRRALDEAGQESARQAALGGEQGRG